MMKSIQEIGFAASVFSNEGYDPLIKLKGCLGIALKIGEL